MRLNRRDDLRWCLIMMLVSLAPVAISGCVETLSSRHVTAKQALLGKSESEVLACAGAPQSVSTREGARILTYYIGRPVPWKPRFLEPKGAVPRGYGTHVRPS